MSTPSDIAALEKDMNDALRATRRRNSISLLLSVVGVALVAFWLYHAHTSFVAVDPNFAADYVKDRDFTRRPTRDLHGARKTCEHRQHHRDTAPRHGVHLTRRGRSG